MCERCCPSRLVLYRDFQSMHAFIILIAISTLLVRGGLYMSNKTNFIKMTDDKWTKLWLNLCEEKGQFLYFWSVLVRCLWYRKYLFTFFAENPSSYAYRRLSPFQPNKFDQNRTKNRMIQQSPTAWSFSADDPLSGWKKKSIQFEWFRRIWSRFDDDDVMNAKCHQINEFINELYH